MPIIECFPSGPFETNAYILACSETNKGVIIDPAPDSAAALIDGSAAIEIKAILLTHSHWDHIGDLKKVKTTFGVPVYVHPSDRLNVVKPGSDKLPLMFHIDGVEPEFDLQEGEVIEVGKLKLIVIETPGHTPGGVCFYLDKEKILFSGDTLFKGSIGKISFPTANPQAMWRSLKKLEKLPPETVVYPGHGPSTTIGDEDWLPKAQELFS
ncbi:MAG: MBL fold metallo-hydrolase [Chlamydiales bacterium]|nr:MBL fold metallo-hydrolase [Chlamydiia bacterium]MCP5503918.1 MBL fold metallo-hydrolase [Chlamydiales bacterium]